MDSTTTDGVAKLASVNTAVSKDTLYSNLITSNTTMFLIKSGAGFITITGVATTSAATRQQRWTDR